MTKISNQYSLTNVLFADAVNGRVGIGTTSPGRTLTIKNSSDEVNGLSFQSYANTTEMGYIRYGQTNDTLDIINTSSYASGGITFKTNSTERMRITSTGNVGINTTFAPAANGLGIAIYKNDYPRITFRNSTTGDQASGGFQFYLNGNDFYQESPGNTIFANGGTERMRILSNGNVLIGSSTDTGDKLRVNGSIASGGTNAGFFFQSRVSGNFLGFYTDNNSTFLVYNTNVGNIATINQSNGNYTALSDINKKKDFEQSTIGLNEVLQLKPTLYRFKTEDDSSPKDLGFIAQEVKELIPQAYSESGEGEKKFIGLNQMPIIAALTKAIQELSAQVSEQQLQINELKALLNA